MYVKIFTKTAQGVGEGRVLLRQIELNMKRFFFLKIHKFRRKKLGGELLSSKQLHHSKLQLPQLKVYW